ncbi:MFS transporter [Hamadaea sp. NPDC050747]|uniref:MFS transporter n=1 Tax=Hamadaea sp. NPDC050747 TaxID=3155789 RepID=UPI0033EE4DA0
MNANRRGLAIYLVARFISTLGGATAPIALAFGVLDISNGSATALGIVLAAAAIPNIAFLLIGGVIGDRFPRIRVIQVAGTISMITEGVAGALLLTDTASVPLLATTQVINGVTSGLCMPAFSGVIPLLASKSDLRRANSLAAGSIGFAMVGGTSLGGLLVHAVGPGWGLVFNAATYAVSVAMMSLLKLPRPMPTEPSVLADFKDGWRQFIAFGWVWRLVLASLFLNLINTGVIDVFGPVVADETFGRATWGLALSAVTLGSLIATGLAAWTKPSYPLRTGLVMSTAMVGFYLAMGLTASTPWLLGMALLGGIGAQYLMINWETALQTRVPTAALSRVSSYDLFGSYLAIPIAQIMAGFLIAQVAVRPLLIGCAVAFVAVVVVSLTRPAVWHERDQTSEAELADANA